VHGKPYKSSRCSLAMLYSIAKDHLLEFVKVFKQWLSGNKSSISITLHR
jgi:hypothetical protein